MAYEALNACGYLRTPVLVLLNDNQQVSLPTGTASAGELQNSVKVLRRTPIISARPRTAAPASSSSPWIETLQEGSSCGSIL